MSAGKERQQVTLVVDGVEVTAPEGAMLVDGAKLGDVEIPVFCYEPKLGQPVGACRMCLVEIEGVPKLQTACSTPVRDGMVVYTQTDRVNEAQSAVVEFLLVNHPLDCPVCDKGGECPLQDIAMGWGPGRSRFTDPKRHFQKPLPLSPLVRIDRERCILCYRCVRFSQEVAEDDQLQLLERGDRSFVGTFDDRPYIAPFHGNIIELCPVGALTSEEYRFRARPWDIEDAGTICTLCPSQCNVKLTVRDERVQRVLARDNSEVDDGWLCDKGRFGFQMIHSPDRITEPMIREGGALRAASWSEAIKRAAAGLRQNGARTAAVVGGRSSNEEGYLVQRIVREVLGSVDVDSRRAGGLPSELEAALARPELSARTADIDDADAALVIGCDPLHEMPILDLRLRKAVRRHGLRLAIATDRPSALDGGAAETTRYAPRDGARFLAALAAAARGGDEGVRSPSSTAEALPASDRGSDPLADAANAYTDEAAEILTTLRDASRVIVVFGERLMRGLDAEGAARGILALADDLGLAEEGSGLIEVPEETNGRGLREAGCLPSAGPGFTDAPGGRDSAGIREALEARELSSLILCEADPVRDHPDGTAWTRGLQAARFVVSIAAFEDASTRHADVIFPAQTYAEKEGTVTHPDGRLQRVRPSIPNAGDVRPVWQVLLELSAALGQELGLHSQPDVFDALASEVPFYNGLTLDEIGGQGIRWQERDGARAAEGREAGADTPSPGATPPISGSVSAEGVAAERRVPGEGASTPAPGISLRLGSYRDLWVGEVTERNPALRFLAPEQTLELAPEDAKRMGLRGGELVTVSSNGHSIEAKVGLRERLRPGGAFLIEGTAEQNANLLAGAQVVEVRPAKSREPETGETS